MKVLFLDAYNLIYRARSGFTKGDYAVIYNFFRGIRPLVEKFSPDKVYFVLEGNPKFRAQLSEGSYKANRISSGDLFHRQKASIINMVSAMMPFYVVKHPDLECDDTIATLVYKHHNEGDESVIISSDSDFIQLLGNMNVKLYNPIRKVFIETPEYDYVTWKALRGDATDNIHGIPGCGDKTATKLMTGKPELLTEYLAQKDRMKIFEKNVNLIRLVDFSNDLSMLQYTHGRLDAEMLKATFADLGFDSMIKEKTWNKYINTFKGL
jgi:DNA polymerase I